MNDADLASMFKGIDNANPQQSSDYFRGGRYLAQVNKFKVHKNDEDLIHYIFEMTILKVLDPSEAAKEPGGPHGVGHEVSWVMAKHKKPTMPNLKGVLMAITGVPKEEVDMKFCAALASSSQPLAGMVVEWANKVITTKGAGKPFTRVSAKRTWSAEEVIEAVGQETLDRLGVELEEEEDSDE